MWGAAGLLILGGRNHALGVGFFGSGSGCFISVVEIRSEISFAPQDVREMLGMISCPSLSRVSRSSSSSCIKMFSTCALACFEYFLVVSISHLPVVSVLFVGMTDFILGCSRRRGLIKDICFLLVLFMGNVDMLNKYSFCDFKIDLYFSGPSKRIDPSG